MPSNPASLIVTMSVGQWDNTLEESYDIGAILLELDENENIINVYQKPKQRNV